MRNIGISLLAALALTLPAGAKTSKAEVTCNDGTTSKAGRGACSHHGGVAREAAPAKKAKDSEEPRARAEKGTTREREKNEPGWLDRIFGRKQSGSAQGRSSRASPRSSTRDARSGTPTARCKDGTTSYSRHRSGTCSGHGGVEEWLKD